MQVKIETRTVTTYRCPHCHVELEMPEVIQTLDEGTQEVRPIIGNRKHMRWTTKEKQVCNILLSSGFKPRVIARRLGRTAAAVSQQIWLIKNKKKVNV